MNIREILFWFLVYKKNKNERFVFVFWTSIIYFSYGTLYLSSISASFFLLFSCRVIKH